MRGTARDRPSKTLLMPTLTRSQVGDLGRHGQRNEAFGVTPDQAVQPTGGVVDLFAWYRQMAGEFVQKRLSQFTGSLSHRGQHTCAKRGLQLIRQNELSCLLTD